MDDLVATAASAAIIVGAVELVKAAAARELLDRSSARKLMHVSVGPIFLLTWRFFSGGPNSPLCAALVPAAMTAKFALTGLGILRGSFLGADAEVRAMSRTGRREELLRGPLLYGVTFVSFTYLAFRQLGAAAALMALCVGDGLAEPVGICYGHALGRLPWNPRKSWAGTLACVLGSLGGSLAFAKLFHAWGWSEASAAQMLSPLGAASLVGAAVESLPLHDVDNLLVPAAVALVVGALAPSAS